MKTAVSIVIVAVLASAMTGCGGAEARKARYLEKGEQFFVAGNYEKASVEFRNALQIAPNDAEARYKVARVAEKLGNPRDAFGHYMAAIDADPKHMPARAALARLYLFGGLAEKALELVEPGLIEQPQNADLLTVRGAARAQTRDPSGALEDAEAAVKLAPDNEYAVALLASLHRQSGRNDEASEVVRAGLTHLPNSTDLRTVLADLELAQKNLSAAQEQLEKVIELQPNELSHRYRLARFHLLTKNLAAAEQTFRDAVEALPKSVEAKTALADLLASNQQYEQAEQELKRFTAANEEDAELHLALGKFYETHRKHELAEQTYRAVIDREDTKPNGLVARNRLAAMLVANKQVEAARTLIDEVLKANARDNDALIMRGNLALMSGDAPGAIADLRAVLRDQPNAVPVMRALARAHLQNGESALAEETLKAAAEANPTDRVLRLELAQLLAQTGRVEQARPMLERVVSEAPNDVGALESLFRVQAAAKDYSAAALTAESLQKARPELPIGWYFAGVLHEARNEPEEAVAAYTRAFDLERRAAEPLTALTRMDVTRKRIEPALARLDAVIAQHPEHVVARNLRGELLLANGKSDAAIAEFSETIARAESWWAPYRGLALAYARAQRNEDAIQTLENGLKQSREPGLLVADLAALYERLGRPDDAIRAYESALAREPRSVSVANNLAMLLVSYRSDQASLDRAQELAAQLASVEEPAILNTRGWVMFKRGEYEGSLPLLQKAVDKAPQSPVMRYHLGMAQLRAGDRLAARENLEAAVAAGKPFSGAKEAQAALDEIKRST